MPYRFLPKTEPYGNTGQVGALYAISMGGSWDLQDLHALVGIYSEYDSLLSLAYLNC